MRFATYSIAVFSAMLAITAGFAADEVPAPQPRTVTIQRERIKLSEALKEINRQTGIEVVSQLKDDPLVSPNLKQRTFWEAVDAIAQEAHAAVISYSPVVLQEVTGKRPTPLVCYSGLYRIALKRITTSTDLLTGDSSCRAILEVAWEPGGRVFWLDLKASTLQVLDEARKPLKLAEEGIKSEPVTEKSAWEVDVHLPSSPRSAKSLGLIEGSLLVKGTARMLKADFKNLNENQTFENGPITVKLLKSDLGKDVWNVKLEMDHPRGGPQFESFQSWVLHDEITVQSQDGKTTLEPLGHEIHLLNDTKAVITYRFAPPGGKKLEGKRSEWKLSYLTSGVKFEVSIPFKFENVPLP